LEFPGNMKAESAAIDGAVYTSPYGDYPNGNPGDGDPYGTYPSNNTLGTASSSAPKQHGRQLGNQTQLSKIDQLRDLQVGAIVPLPQVRHHESPVYESDRHLTD